RVEQCVEHGEPEDAVAPEVFVIFEADEDAWSAHARVGKAQPDAETERVSQKHMQQHGRRKHEQRTEKPAPLSEAGERRGLGWCGRGLNGHLESGVSVNPCRRLAKRQQLDVSPVQEWQDSEGQY